MLLHSALRVLDRIFDKAFRVKLLTFATGISSEDILPQLKEKLVLAFTQLQTLYKDKLEPTLVRLFYYGLSHKQLEGVPDETLSKWVSNTKAKVAPVIKESKWDIAIVTFCAALAVAYQIYRLKVRYEKVKKEIDLQESFLEILKKALSNLVRSALIGLIVGVAVVFLKRRLQSKRR